MTADPQLAELDLSHRNAILNFRAFLARDESDGLLRDNDFQTFGQLGLNAGRLRPALAWLVDHGWMKHRGPPNGDHFTVFEFTARGAQLADLLVEGDDDDAPISASLDERNEAADAVNRLSRAAGQSNQLVADHPQRLPMYRASIEAGAGVLRAHAPTRAMVRATLLGPANWIMQQAATAAVRDAADHAIRLLTGLL